MPRPIETINRLTDALNRGDLEAAVSCYESTAVLVVRPGQPARGTDALRAALGGFIALKPRLTALADHVVVAEDIALHVGRWTLEGTDPAGQPVSMGGVSSDVLRRQPDGRWLIAVDNPWGAQILEPR